MIVVGRRTLTGVSKVDSIAYVCGLAIDTTKFVSCEKVSLRRCEMTSEPSGVGMSVGVAVAYSDVILLVAERWEMAVVRLARGSLGEYLGLVRTCLEEAGQWKTAPG